MIIAVRIPKYLKKHVSMRLDLLSHTKIVVSADYTDPIITYDSKTEHIDSFTLKTFEQYCRINKVVFLNVYSKTNKRAVDMFFQMIYSNQ